MYFFEVCRSDCYGHLSSQSLLLPPSTRDRPARPYPFRRWRYVSPSLTRHRRGTRVNGAEQQRYRQRTAHIRNVPAGVWNSTDGHQHKNMKGARGRDSQHVGNRPNTRKCSDCFNDMMCFNANFHKQQHGLLRSHTHNTDLSARTTTGSSASRARRKSLRINLSRRRRLGLRPGSWRRRVISRTIASRALRAV